jgi:hypothetical protein
MFRRFPEGADERLPCLAEAKNQRGWFLPQQDRKPEHDARSTRLQGKNQPLWFFASAIHGSLSSAPSENLLNMTPDPQGYKAMMVNTCSLILALSYWVNGRSVALDLFPTPDRYRAF